MFKRISILFAVAVLLSSIYLLCRWIHHPDYHGLGAVHPEESQDFTWHSPENGHGNSWGCFRDGNNVAYFFRATDNFPYLRRIDVLVDDLSPEHTQWVLPLRTSLKLAYDGVIPPKNKEGRP